MKEHLATLEHVREYIKTAGEIWLWVIEKCGGNKPITAIQVMEFTDFSYEANT